MTIGKYNVIYADPPWRYAQKGLQGAAERHYPTMGIEELCALPVAELAAPDSVLFLWATFPQLPEALRLIKAWGFQYTPMLNAREQTAAILTTVCTLRDPHQTLGKLYSDLVGPGGNRVNYMDADLDAMLDKAAAETDSAERLELYADIQQYLYDRVVYIPLYNMKTMTATTAKIRGFDLILPTNYQKYNNVYFVD